ncbi:hypothetical protein NG799_28345 [Laspinema sp. D1]|uniref:Secreted protein n=1 Tax=Laspinema palackyanum D2a TaxID=2953684 RepID=A0ABT2N2A7_9CYAN|nr:hypothetical protein [Laspinema sp. D2a]
MSRSNRLKKLYLSLLLCSIVLPIAAIGQASPNYQERDGIYGEIKFAEFCNVPNALRARVVAEAGSRDSRVSSVEFKIYSRYSYGVNLWNQTFGYVTGENWRPIGVPNTLNNTRDGDRRFYDTTPMTYPLTSVVSSPIKFSIHVNHSRGKTIDLGGIVDMGVIEPGQCRIYDDGNFR